MRTQKVQYNLRGTYLMSNFLSDKIKLPALFFMLRNSCLTMNFVMLYYTIDIAFMEVAAA